MKRSSRPDATRNRRLLIETAREVFAEQGIAAPLDTVAKRAGLGNATLYRHFPTRETLIVETFRLDLQRHAAALARAIEHESAWEGLTEWLRFCFHDQLTDIGLTQSLITVSRGTDGEVDDLRAQTLSLIQDLMEAAKREGRLRADLWLEDLLLHLLAHAALVERRTSGSRAASDRWFELMISLLSTERAPEYSESHPPQTVLAVRSALQHALRGEPVGSDDI